MLCHQARQRLSEHDWCYGGYSHDSELMEHLGKCAGCFSLVQAEEALRSDARVVRETEPDCSLTIDALKEKVSTGRSQPFKAKQPTRSLPARLVACLAPNTRYKLAAGIIVVLVAFVAFVPFSFREKVGYQIAIAGVDRTIAQDNQKIFALLDALGMQKDKASSLLDSLGLEDIHLSVGECQETCHLTISDLKTERDVRLVVKAIIDLGCCQIDDIIPIFRNQSTSLLRLAARKLLS